MNIIFTSESVGKASSGVRRILDHYAVRIGSDVWEAQVTEEGLRTVKSLLNRASSRFTSVACHRISYNGLRELLWVVGNKAMFNSVGACCTGVTEKRFHGDDAERPYPIKLMSRITGIAGLLHDIGKASRPFADTLRKALSGEQAYQHCRHDAVGCLMLTWLTKYGPADADWISELRASLVDGSLDRKLRSSLQSAVETLIRPNGGKAPLPGLDAGQGCAPALLAIRWLILSHHRLPYGAITANDVYMTLERHVNESIPFGDIRELESRGTPWQDEAWLARLDRDLQDLLQLIQDERYLSLAPALPDLARLIGRHALQWADYHVSAQRQPCPQQADHLVYANTVRIGDRVLMGQTLVRHTTSVSRMAGRLVGELLDLRKRMPALDHAELPRALTRTGRAVPPSFQWQDKAIRALRDRPPDLAGDGFLGFILSETGSGKTLGAMKIASALGVADGLRVLYGSPLRSLTLQSGDEFHTLGFAESDLATITGDSLIQRIHDAQEAERGPQAASHAQVLLDLYDDHADGEEERLVDGGSDALNLPPSMTILSPREKRVAGTPVVAATLDTVMRLADGRRGAALAQLIRMASSDLVIDEIDQYGTTDQLAIGRLMEQAGFWRSRIILSSATLAPQLAVGMWNAYRTGLRVRQILDGLDRTAMTCAWFSESTDPVVEALSVSCNEDVFTEKHLAFARTTSERRSEGKRQVASYLQRKPTAVDPVDADTLLDSIADLHSRLKIAIPGSPGRTMSFGCVQVVNVKHCQEIALLLAGPLRQRALEGGINLRVICLHGRQNLATRTAIEAALTVMLTRKGDKGDLAPLKHQAVRDFVERSPGMHNVIVLVSTVETTGRDHDFDWGIIESRRERDIIQFAGRIRRHRRRHPVDIRNLTIWDYPLRGDAKGDGKGATAYTMFGLADSLPTDTGFPNINLRRREQTATWGWNPQYSEMMQQTYGDRFPVISPVKSITQVDADPAECRIAVKPAVHTVRAAEARLLNTALMAPPRPGKQDTLTEWLASGMKHAIGRLLCRHADRFRFRMTKPTFHYWRNGDGVWHHVDEEWLSNGGKSTRRKDRKTVPSHLKAQGKRIQNFENETILQGLLLRIDDRNEVDALAAKIGTDSFYDRVSMGAVPHSSLIANDGNYLYEPQIGLIHQGK